MKKDIFIDNNIAKSFASAKDFEYIKLIVWLMQLSKNEIDCIFQKMPIDKKEILYSLFVPKEDTQNTPYLVRSQKIQSEYFSSSSGAKSITAMTNIISRLTSDRKRFNDISNAQIKDFIQTNRPIFDKLTHLKKDLNHIPVVLLSDRKYAITIDEAFSKALREFPRYADCKVESRPENLPYEK